MLHKAELAREALLRNQEKPKGGRAGQDKPGGARRSHMGSQGEPGGARRGARGSQEEPGGPRGSHGSQGNPGKPGEVRRSLRGVRSPKEGRPRRPTITTRTPTGRVGVATWGRGGQPRTLQHIMPNKGMQALRSQQPQIDL